MKRQLLQLLTTPLRSLLTSIMQRLKSGLAFVLLGLLISAGLMLPPSAIAQTATTVATSSKTTLNRQNFFANQPIASATSRTSAIVVNRLRRDLSKRTKVPIAKLKTIEAVPTTWNDGCFGLAELDEVCTQALLEGWRVEFSNGSQRWVYRADQQGQHYRLEGY